MPVIGPTIALETASWISASGLEVCRHGFLSAFRMSFLLCDSFFVARIMPKVA